jgi:hypothetical protein
MKRKSAAQNTLGCEKTFIISAGEWAWAAERMSGMERVPVASKSRNIPRRNPKSPMRLVMKAFLPASALALSEYQKPMSR